VAWIRIGDRIERQQGLCDDRVPLLQPTQFDEHHKRCATERRAALGDERIVVVMNGAVPVATRHIPVYRIHSRAHFQPAPEFPANWDDTPRRRLAEHRFSPGGVSGYYFGLTLDAALDEALHYGNGSIAADVSLILVMDCYFDNLLYLMHPLVIGDIWKKAGLGDTDYFSMYLTLMDPGTNNHACNRLGLWARERGFDGVIYPSARYGQQGARAAAERDGYQVVPAVNFVPLGTKLCGHEVEPAGWFNQMLAHQRLSPDDTVPVFAEPNLVLFSNAQLTAKDRCTFYWTFPVDAAPDVARADRRLASKTYTHFMKDDFGSASIATMSGANSWLVEAPLRPRSALRTAFRKLKKRFS
jgi:hypothetical protein